MAFGEKGFRRSGEGCGVPPGSDRAYRVSRTLDTLDPPPSPPSSRAAWVLKWVMDAPVRSKGRVLCRKESVYFRLGLGRHRKDLSFFPDDVKETRIHARVILGGRENQEHHHRARPCRSVRTSAIFHQDLHCFSVVGQVFCGFLFFLRSSKTWLYAAQGMEHRSGARRMAASHLRSSPAVREVAGAGEGSRSSSCSEAISPAAPPPLRRGHLCSHLL